MVSVNGGEEYINTHDLNGEELVAKWVEYMRGRSGYPVERLLKYQHPDSFLSVILIMQLPVQLQMASPAAKEWLQKRREDVQPWTHFVNTSKFKDYKGRACRQETFWSITRLDVENIDNKQPKAGASFSWGCGVMGDCAPRTPGKSSFLSSP
ncbi:uncharacterized protein LOC143025216 isoform X2 [Oratosquilla oratoria]|uniref:uncharacterized protein LOC143025216 isoform X2 n=1 Tax=Oratosquilla oratoria TaxID=337810 RepID=UPI003F76D8EA